MIRTVSRSHNIVIVAAVLITSVQSDRYGGIKLLVHTRAVRRRRHRRCPRRDPASFPTAVSFVRLHVHPVRHSRVPSVRTLVSYITVCSDYPVPSCPRAQPDRVYSVRFVPFYSCRSFKRRVPRSLVDRTERKIRATEERRRMDTSAYKPTHNDGRRFLAKKTPIRSCILIAWYAVETWSPIRSDGSSWSFVIIVALRSYVVLQTYSVRRSRIDGH